MITQSYEPLLGKAHCVSRYGNRVTMPAYIRVTPLAAP
jgi:hypothetical protein